MCSYRDYQLDGKTEKFVSCVPVHWIEQETLWYPPLNKSEASDQTVNPETWRKYIIRNVYEGTRTNNKTEGDKSAKQICVYENNCAETTTTDCEETQVSPKITQTGTKERQQPPAAPNATTVSQFELGTANSMKIDGKRSTTTDSEDDVEGDHPLALPNKNPKRGAKSDRRLTKKSKSSLPVSSVQQPTYTMPADSTAIAVTTATTVPAGDMAVIFRSTASTTPTLSATTPVTSVDTTSTSTSAAVIQTTPATSVDIASAARTSTFFPITTSTPSATNNGGCVTISVL